MSSGVREGASDDEDPSEERAPDWDGVHQRVDNAAPGVRQVMRQATPGIRWGLARHEPTREALVEVVHAQAAILAEALEADLIARARQ